MPPDAAPLDFLYVLPTGMSHDPEGRQTLVWAPGEGPFRTGRTLAPTAQPHVVQFRRAAFTADECARIIALGDSLPVVGGDVAKGENVYRVSHIAWIEPTEPARWIFHRLGMLFMDANRPYGFDLIGFVDALQYTVYGPGERFDWHLDLGTGSTRARKLSMTVQLSDGTDYDGGDLQFIATSMTSTPRDRGGATIFPSYLPHCVTPVTRGIRRSLVAWAYGPTFR